MGNKMLIDATHPEETRVVVTRGNRVEEFDYESATRKQRRGNIYLAKVARIEPSLQAAFVNYGGNRHGFLAFSEIHPDYYQIPVAVREALMKEEAQERQARNHEILNDGAQDAPIEDSELAEAASGDSVQAESYGSGNDAECVGAPVGADVAEAAAEPQDTQAEQAVNVAQFDQELFGARETSIPLEAVLPPTVYEEFTAAVARAEEARDEIPSYPVSAEEESAFAGVASESGFGRAEIERESGHSEEEVKDDASLPRGSSDDESNESWDSSETRNEGGVISVAEAPTAKPVEVVGAEDAMEEVPQRVKRRWRHYKIQEVIKRNQIVLVQVVKEERGTKGAALTTYLSLAGRYTVLMPNTASGGGISRKITVPADRKRLKEIAQELEVPEGMGLIIRTAGASRTKAEIKRDFEYLLRLWENVRDLTLRSTAPCLVYEEGDLIKRSIRDLYNKDIDEILVAGDDAYRDAKEFMRMLMPSHAKNVQLYKEPEPLFTKYEVERQLNQMFSPVVTLRSGGYIVLNQTEALVAIDVNSGRATREYSIEDTALKTNLEAAEEIARQVRLRDLAGLIVIDFIDMDERRNNRSVERRLKECLRHDRARIQVGHISHFGLLEMSRQRLRQGVVEVSTMPCPTCQGVGHIRSTESVSLMILRSIEDHLRTHGAANITASASPEASLYILNHKRTYLRDIELRYGVSILITADEKARGAQFGLERGAEATAPVAEDAKAIHMDPAIHNGHDDEEEAFAEGDDRRSSRRRRRRRRGRGEASVDHSQHNGTTASFRPEEGAPSRQENELEGREQDERAANSGEVQSPEAMENSAILNEGMNGIGEGESNFRRHRRRGRRGGRRHRPEQAPGGDFAQPQNDRVIPGLGEQPVVNFDHDFLGRIQPNPAPAPRQEEQAAESRPTSSVVLEVPVTQPESPQVVPLETEPKQPVASDQPPPALSLAPEVLATASGNVEAAVEEPPVEASEPLVLPEPKVRPVRTGPARKGWWQRSVG